MKCKTVHNGVVTNNILMEKKFSKKNQVSYFAITVGENGRGRHLAFMAADPSVETNPLTTCSIRRTQRGSVIVASDGDESPSTLLLKIHVDHGFRGGTEYYLPDDVVVLYTGVHADGDAGRMASSQEHIMMVPAGTKFTVRRTGRLYGDPSTYAYEWDGEMLIAYVVEDEPDFS